MASKNDVTVPSIDFKYNSVKDKVGKVVKEARNKKGYTIEKLSEITGVSGATISGIESGKSVNPNSENLVRLALALGFSLDSLFGIAAENSESNDDTEVMDILKAIAKLIDCEMFKINATEDFNDGCGDQKLEIIMNSFISHDIIFGKATNPQGILFFEFAKEYSKLSEVLKDYGEYRTVCLESCIKKHLVYLNDPKLIDPEPDVPF